MGADFPTNSNIENVDKSYFSYEELFTINDIKEINESAKPKGTISTIIEKFSEKINIILKKSLIFQLVLLIII